MRGVLRAAEERGSDFYMAHCGFCLAVEAPTATARVGDLATLQDPPSTFLLWLQQGEAAHRRCKSVLPKRWTHPLTHSKRMALPIKSWLQQLQREGDRWRLPQLELVLEMLQYPMAQEPQVVALTCHGCGKPAAQLHRCSGCKEVQYCR